MELPVLESEGYPTGVQDIYLQPGDFHWGDARCRIKTLLGSCIAICFWHPTRRIGGMSHCLLPTRNGAPSTQPLSGRYVDETLAMFYARIRREATDRSDYQIKIFGGGNMFEAAAKPTDGFKLSEKSSKAAAAATALLAIGERNLQMARKILSRDGLRIAAEHAGGRGHRYVIFELWSGNVWLRHSDTLPGA